jgi:benzoate/toluate 1,2-dioxygenase reductase subunit
MSQWLTQRAIPGDRLTLSGPMGSFYLRGGERPLLLLAGAPA